MSHGPEIVTLPVRDPAKQIPAEDLVFTADEKAQLEEFKTRYAEVEGAVMRGLWLAQEKFGYRPPEVIKLVADELGMSYARAYGVATFYTQYYKEEVGKYVLDVCTCFSCQLCGGYDMLHYLENKLGIKEGETTDDGMFSVKGVECLGACGSAPMLQVTNGPYVFNLTEEKLDAMIDALRGGTMPPFTSVTLPQDEDEMGGNRRSDVESTETYTTPPFAAEIE
ncbi:MAG: NAD(P)H-dependent oxidoreductase subunit E [Rhodothermales bacterium]|nr:NAD(P)H-dependent oxidoreductase subunit E [Rhodothermales bacterium]